MNIFIGSRDNHAFMAIMPAWACLHADRALPNKGLSLSDAQKPLKAQNTWSWNMPYMTTKLFTRILSIHNYETAVASDGFEAGIKVKEFKPFLIILDRFMPGMDGFEVCKRIKENPRTSHIKILALTGYDTKENRDRIMQAGADGYLANQVKRRTFLEQVESLLNRKQYVRSGL